MANKKSQKTKGSYTGKFGKTRRIKSSDSSTLAGFQKEITVVFLEILMMVKLFHWKTSSYATHKATDELYTKLNGNIDSFIEVLLGKTGSRIDLMSNKHIRLIDLSSQESLKREVEAFKGYLVSLSDNKAMLQMSNTDLFNIRDTILGDLNQFLYLLTFK
jgi:DNA-binding ferritin-like protein